MTKIIEKIKLKRKDKKLIKKLRYNSFYLGIIGTVFFLFKPVKKFISIEKKSSKKGSGIISYSIFKMMGLKIGLIDDFIINRKIRGNGKGRTIFNKAIEKTSEENADYAVLVTKESKKREVAKRFYKRAGFTIISFGLFAFGYKKLRKK